MFRSEEKLLKDYSEPQKVQTGQLPDRDKTKDRHDISDVQFAPVFSVRKHEDGRTELTVQQGNIKNSSTQVRKEYWRLWNTNVTIPSTELFKHAIQMVEVFRQENGSDAVIHVMRGALDPLLVEAVILYCKAVEVPYANHTDCCANYKLTNKRALIVKDLLVNNAEFRAQSGYERWAAQAALHPSSR